MKEMLDVYDIHGNKTGRVAERYHHKEDGAYFLCVHAYIMTPEHKFIIQKRSLEKKYFPGIWDITCGAALSGETSLDAVLREVREEIGLNLSECIHRLIGRTVYLDSLNDVYLFSTPYHTSDCILDTAEVTEVKEVSHAELLDLIKKSQFKDEEYYNMIKLAIK